MSVASHQDLKTYSRTRAKKTVVFGTCVVLLFLVSALLGGLESRISSAASKQEGIVIPLYTYPTDGTWSEVIQAKQSYPSVPIVAIINPNSGPGSSKDVNYVNGIANLEAAGVTVLGYVATGYGTSSYSGISNVEQQISQYELWYPKVQGIFFDEMSGSASTQSYYQTLKDYVSSLGMGLTFGNPGTVVDASLVGIFSNLVIYENPGIPSAGSIDHYLPTYGSAGFSFIAYGVRSLPGHAAMQTLESYVSYVYVTNLGGSNPYGALPSYFLGEVAALASSTSSSSSTVTGTTSSRSTSSSNSSISHQSSSTTSTIVTTPDTTTTSTARTTTFSVSSSSSENTITGPSSTSSETEIYEYAPVEVNLSVTAILPNGSVITGSKVALTSGNGFRSASNYSPAIFAVVVGQNYTVTPLNFGSYVFSYWNDTHSTFNSRSMEISQPTKLIAVFVQLTANLNINVRAITQVSAATTTSGWYPSVWTSSGATEITFTGNYCDH